MESFGWIFNLLPAVLATMVAGCYAQRVALENDKLADHANLN